MGSSETVRQKIVTKIEVTIETTNQNYMNLVNSKTTDVMNTFTQRQVSEIKNNSSALNSATISNLTVTGGSSFNLNQQNELKVIARAILNIQQSSSVISEIVNSSKQQITNALESDTNLQSDLKLANDISKKKENSGEFNTFIDKVQGMVSDLLGKDVTSETDIENSIKQSLKTENTQTLNINEYVNNTFNNTINQETFNTCSSDTSSGNIITLTNITISGGSTFETTQKNIVKQTQDCILSASLSVESLEYLKNANDVAAGQSIENIVAAKVAASLESIASNSESNKSFGDIIADAIKGIMSNIVIIAIIAGIGICVLIFGPMILNMFNDSSESSSGPVGPVDTLNKAIKFIINFSK
jgi:hypothetical protein